MGKINKSNVVSLKAFSTKPPLSHSKNGGAIAVTSEVGKERSLSCDLLNFG
jgi:hypothetical protein